MTEGSTLVGCTARRPIRQTARSGHGERSSAMTCHVEHKINLEEGGDTHGVCGIVIWERGRFLVIPQSGVARSLLGALWHGGTLATSIRLSYNVLHVIASSWPLGPRIFGSCSVRGPAGIREDRQFRRISAINLIQNPRVFHICYI